MENKNSVLELFKVGNKYKVVFKNKIHGEFCMWFSNYTKAEDFYNRMMEGFFQT